jgi:hypothetical protein
VEVTKHIIVISRFVAVGPVLDRWDIMALSRWQSKNEEIELYISAFVFGLLDSCKICIGNWIIGMVPMRNDEFQLHLISGFTPEIVKLV